MDMASAPLRAFPDNIDTHAHDAVPRVVAVCPRNHSAAARSRVRPEPARLATFEPLRGGGLLLSRFPRKRAMPPSTKHPAMPRSPAQSALVERAAASGLRRT